MNKHIVRTVAISCMLAFAVFSASALANTPNERSATAQEAVKTRLEGAKLQSCEKRERVINSILDRIAARGERRLGVYTKIYERVQEFYTKKGLSISNYDALKAEVTAKKDAAQAAVDEIKSKNIEFACDGSDPKGAAAGFKADLKAEIEALHAYQQALKNFIVAVKTSIGDQQQ